MNGPQSNPSVSIALAVYNGEKFLPELLTSLENQTHKPLELVVLDDCSSDNSIEIINSFTSSFKKRIFHNKENMGPVYTFKKLASLCSGEYIAFCDQDDIWIPEKLQLSMSEFNHMGNDVAGIVFTDLSIISEEGKLVETSFWRIRKLVSPKKFDFSDILCSNIITGCTALINKQMANELTKMPANVIMHDWWMALIAFSVGEYAFVARPTVMYRSHSNSVTSKDKTTFFTIFLDEFKHRDTYFTAHIQQAIEFKKLYQHKLSRKNLNVLNRFIRLRNKGFFQKRFFRDSKSLLRRFR